jgi:hypothetical protein
MKTHELQEETSPSQAGFLAIFLMNALELQEVTSPTPAAFLG